MENGTVTPALGTACAIDTRWGVQPLVVYPRAVAEVGVVLGECAWTVLGAAHVRAA